MHKEMMPARATDWLMFRGRDGTPLAMPQNPAQSATVHSTSEPSLRRHLLRVVPAAAVLIIGLASQAAVAASTVTTTESYDYDLTTGRMVKTMSEPGDPALCTVTEYDIDSAYGQEKGRTLRNCNGASPVTPGATPETTASAGQAAFNTRRSQVGYSADRRFVTSRVNPLQQVALTTSDGRFGLPTSVTDPNGLTTSIAYDGLGRKVLETYADKTQVRWTYIYCRNLFVGGVAVAAPMGANTADCAGVWAPETTRGTNGGMTTPSHFVREQPLQADGQTANGPWKLTYYDTLGRPLRTSTLAFNGAAVINTDTRYTVRGQVAAVSEPYFEGEVVYWTEFTYDTLGREVRRTQQTAAGQAVVSTSYSGLQTTITDSRQFSTSTTQNMAGQIETITDAKGGTLRRLYDPAGHVVQTTDPSGNITSIVYDLRGRRTALYDPDLGVRTYDYDALGQEVKYTDAKNQVVTQSFDLLGRMVSHTAPDLTSRWYFDAYADGSPCPNGIGKTCEEASDNGYAKKYAYDAVGRIGNTSTTFNGATYTDQVTYAVATGRIDTQTYPTGVKLQYGYSAAGHLSSVTDTRNGLKLWEATDRDARLALRQARQGNGVVTNWSYYVDGRVRSIQVGGSTLPNIGYQYDLAGNITQRSDSSVNSSFGYDELNRLTVETRWGPGLTGEPSVRWEYDAIGNILSHSETGGVSSTYLYNSSGSGSRRPHAVAAVNGEVNGNLFPRYVYDESGNLVNGAGRTVTWTAEDMVRSVIQGGAQLTYWYGPVQQRVKEEYSQNGTAVRTTVYLNPPAGSGLFFEHESGTAGTKKKHYVSADGQTVAVIVCTADPCTTASNTTTQYWHLDALGSVMATTDSAGAMLERMAYEPFGKRRNGNGATDLYGTLTLPTDRGFTGHEHMQEVGLINMNGRIFEPGLARFLSADPTVPFPDSTQSYNRYSYARNNPLRSIDPSGFTDIYTGPGSGYLGIDAFGFDSIFGFSFSERQGSRILLNPNAFDAGSGSDTAQFKCDAACGEGTFNGLKVGARAVAGYASNAVDSVITGGYGHLSAQAWDNGEYGMAAVHTVAGVVYGLANAATMGSGALINSVRAMGSEMVAMAGSVALKAEALFSSKLSLYTECFTAGTPVHTAAGLTPIEDIREGDFVAARDEQTGELSWRPAVRLFRNADKETVQVSYVNGRGEEETLGASLEHPFRVAGRGWVGAGELKPGDRLVRRDGGSLTVRSVVRDPVLRDTFNFEVAGIHTYFVGGLGVWVHNASVIGDALAAKGLEGANFAQKTFGSMFSKGGAFAGKSVDDVAGALRSGAMKPSEVPIDFIVRDGNRLILNTRSAQALEAAGVPRSQWNAVNRTGQEAFESMLSGQLQRNGLTSEGVATVRRSGM